MLQATLSLCGEIDTYMRESGIPNNRWYVGVTSDIEERLFGYHNVVRIGGQWAHGRCLSAAESRDLEAAYHRAGCQGAGGGGDHRCVYIYAYVITPTTVE
jgi:hypothetical protein